MMRMRMAPALVSALACLVINVGCDSPVEVRPPTVEGTIVELRSSPLTILVKPGPNQCGYELGLDSETEIRRVTANESTVAATADELRVGLRVRAWADGQPLLSCPAMGRAERVIIVP
jgi:hypothetical protein